MITDYIPTGRKNAITRKELCRITGLSDRQAREHIAQARRNTPIINLQDGDGYFIPNPSDNSDMSLLKRYVRQEEAIVNYVSKKTAEEMECSECPLQKICIYEGSVLGRRHSCKETRKAFMDGKVSKMRKEKRK